MADHAEKDTGRARPGTWAHATRRRGRPGLTDTQISVLIGFAFAIFYSVFGIPIGRLVDARSRRLIIAAGITVWSLATAACGLARSFWTLFLGRIGVGAGEATLGPAAMSMISDLFPPERRGTAIAVFITGSPAPRSAPGSRPPCSPCWRTSNRSTCRSSGRCGPGRSSSSSSVSPVCWSAGSRWRCGSPPAATMSGPAAYRSAKSGRTCASTRC